MTGFDAYAVDSPTGPHVTMQLGVEHVGHYVTTTSRRSAKVAVLANRPWAAITRRDEEGWSVLGGPTEALDPGRPTDLLGSPIASLVASGGVVRLAVENLDQLLGYAQVGCGVPTSWLPTGRVALVTTIRDRLRVEGGDVVEASGRFEAAPARLRAHRPGQTWDLGAVLHDAPDAVAELVRTAGSGWLGVLTPAGPVALPGHWDPSLGRMRVDRGVLARVGAKMPGEVCMTVDDSADRRADRKVGVMLRGHGTVVGLEGRGAVVAIVSERLTHWSGFVSATRLRTP